VTGIYAIAGYQTLMFTTSNAGASMRRRWLYTLKERWSRSPDWNSASINQFGPSYETVQSAREFLAAKA
jgi:hypothetical protein